MLCLRVSSSTLRTARSVFLFAAFLASIIISPAQKAPVAPAGPYSISGRVVNGVTGEAVPRATVSALDEESRQVVQSVQSDADGRFALERLAAGKYPLTASKRGYRTGFYDEHEEFNSAIVTGPDQDTTHLQFRLMPAAMLHGVVTADGGDPAENASVILFKRERGGGSDQINQVDGTMTDDTGAFEFSNLAGGEYLLAVSTSPWYAMHPPPTAGRNPTSEESPLDVTYPVTYFDSTTDEASAAPITLPPGSREEADVYLHAVPALHLKVAAPRKGEGIAQPELRQMIFGMEVSAESSAAFDPIRTGVVEFNSVAPGHYELIQGDPPRVVELDAGSNQEVDPNAGTLALSITGALRTANGAALPENLNVVLEPIGGRARAAMQADGHKGEFRFDAVPPGVWGLSVSTLGNTLPVVSVLTGGSPIPGNQITIKDRPVAVVATVSPSSSQVRGFARLDGKGVAGVMVVLAPRQPSAYRALVRRDQSDSDGSFSLRDVPAGQYTVVAIEDGWNLDWTERDNIARYLPGGRTVTVSGQSGAVITLGEPVPVQPR